MSPSKEAPEIRTELLISEDKDDPARFMKLVHFGMLVDVAGFNASKDSLTSERLALFHRNHKSVAVWTVNETGEMRRFAEMGVDAIITNYPGNLLEGTCRRSVGRSITWEIVRSLQASPPAARFH